MIGDWGQGNEGECITRRSRARRFDSLPIRHFTSQDLQGVSIPSGPVSPPLSLPILSIHSESVMPSSWDGKDDELTLVDSDGPDSIPQEQARGALVRRAPSARRYDAVTRAEAKKELHRLCHELARLSQEVAQDCLSGLATDPWPAELETIQANIQNLQNRLGTSWCPQPGHDEDEDRDDQLLGDNDDDSRLVLHSSGARLFDFAAAEELSTDEFARTAPVISGARSHRRAQGSRRGHVEYSGGSTQPHRGIDNASHGGRRGHSPGGIYTDRPSTMSSRDFLRSEQSTAGWTTSHYTQRVAPRHERDSRHIRDPGPSFPELFAQALT